MTNSRPPMFHEGRMRFTAFFGPFGRVFESMPLGVIALRKQFEILRSIIRAYFVDVMHVFGRLEIPTNHLFHNKAMLKYMAVCIGGRVSGHFHMYISTGHIAATSPPAPACAVSDQITSGEAPYKTCREAGMRSQRRWLFAAAFAQFGLRLVSLYQMAVSLNVPNLVVAQVRGKGQWRSATAGAHTTGWTMAPQHIGRPVAEQVLVGDRRSATAGAVHTSSIAHTVPLVVDDSATLAA